MCGEVACSRAVHYSSPLFFILNLFSVCPLVSVLILSASSSPPFSHVFIIFHDCSSCFLNVPLSLSLFLFLLLSPSPQHPHSDSPSLPRCCVFCFVASLCCAALLGCYVAVLLCCLTVLLQRVFIASWHTAVPAVWGASLFHFPFPFTY